MKLNALTFLGLSLCGLATPTLAQTDSALKMPILVCRAQQCAEARYSMTRGFLYNKIAQMMKKNENKDVLICEADPISHVCLSEGIVIPAFTPLDKINISIDKLHLADSKIANDTTLDLVFDYKIRANKMFPKCQLGRSELVVSSLDNTELLTQDFGCDITETGHTSINATFDINYLDFDYGFMGAFYTIGVGETVTGDKSGYALMRFTKRVPLTQTPPSIELPKGAILMSESDTDKLSEFKTVDTTKTNSILQETTALSPVIIQEVAAPKKTVIKTEKVEKITLNSDGSHQIDPPESRTIVEELNK